MAAQTQTQAATKVNGAAQAAACSKVGIEVNHVDTASAPSVVTSALGDARDQLAALGIEMPSWKSVAFGFVAAIAAAVAAYVAAPVLAAILTAGTLTVTANGFALWMASALGYLITTWAAFKTVRLVTSAASWLSKFAPATPTAA